MITSILITFKKLAALTSPEIPAKLKLIVAPVYIADTANTVPTLTNVLLNTNPAIHFYQVYTRVSYLSASNALTLNFESPLSTLYKLLNMSSVLFGCTKKFRTARFCYFKPLLSYL